MAGLSFDDAVKTLKGKDSKKLENNTYLVRVDADSVGVKLHNTVVVYIYKSGNYQYDSGGWRSVTTKDRINKYGPVGIHQKDNVWYIGEGIYEDGVMLDNDGKPLLPLREPDKVQKKKRELDKLVREYVKGYAENAKRVGLYAGESTQSESSDWDVVRLGERPEPLKPSMGDCWACACGAMSAEEPMGLDHLLSHFEEKYYVPSLLYKAIVTAGYKDPAFIWAYIAGDINNRKDTSYLERVLTTYFRKKKPALLELLTK